MDDSAQIGYAKVTMWLVAFAAITIGTVKGGSCREATLCCNGRDSSCVVQKVASDTASVDADTGDKPCYCDHACLKLGDCCEDFKLHCGVTDCTVSDWGSWSECDTSCGTGMMHRARTILESPTNGGKHCPSMVQKRGCQGFQCHSHSDKQVLHEMAMLLPADMSKSRRINDTEDTRHNVIAHYPEHVDHEYCIEFEVTKAAKACHKMLSYKRLAEGDRVAIRCDPEALIHDTATANEMSDTDEAGQRQRHNVSRCRGEGLTGRTTRWTSLEAPSCRGKWLRLTLGEPKKCKDSQFSFM